MKLKVEIDVAGAAMQTGWELADALRRAANEVAYLGNEPVPEPVSAQRIGDLNGNRAGSWWIEGER
jgi:hypothetical protein